MANPLSRVVQILGSIGATLSIASVNPGLGIVGWLLPAFICTLLYRPGHPQVILFGALFQWAQAFSPVLSANIAGVPLNSTGAGSTMRSAAWLSLLSIVALTSGMRYGQKIFKGATDSRQLTEESKLLSTSRLFVAYLIGSIVSLAILQVARHAGGLRQPILAFAAVKWVPIFLIAWTTLQHNRHYGYLTFIVTAEVAIGFTGYFSSFKQVLFMVGIIGLGTSLSSRVHWASVILVCVTTIVLATFWQAIKSDYRRFLNGGTGQQVVLVSVQDRIQFLLRAAVQVTPKKLSDGFLSGTDRLGYITFFGHALRHVPERVPHQNGALWWGAVTHTFMPRILFPSKAEIDESERTTRYTGVRVAGRSKGTSVSLGYPAESYVDFGVPLMFIPIFILGGFYSWVYEYLGNRKNGLLGIAVATSLLLNYISNFGASSISMVGGLTTGLIAFAALIRIRSQWYSKMLEKRAISASGAASSKMA